jgi:hypothetical protein
MIQASGREIKKTGKKLHMIENYHNDSTTPEQIFGLSAPLSLEALFLRLQEFYLCRHPYAHQR